jgi:hypothetical protein
LSRFLSICCCFLSCLFLAEPPFPLSFLPSLRGDSHLFSRMSFPLRNLLFCIQLYHIIKVAELMILLSIEIIVFNIAIGNFRIIISKHSRF